VLCGLKRNAQRNGKTGSVKSRLSKGRQHLFINDLPRSFGWFETFEHAVGNFKDLK
jgi:hypothetical protein